jgi:hypothetical protein
MLEAAQEARRRVLADMAQRRRAVTDQIDQFRAARDELSAAVSGVRADLDAILDNLARADDNARSAAAAAHHAPRAEDEQSLVDEAERAAAAIGLEAPTAPGTTALLDQATGRSEDPGLGDAPATDPRGLSPLRDPLAPEDSEPAVRFVSVPASSAGRSPLRVQDVAAVVEAAVEVAPAPVPSADEPSEDLAGAVDQAEPAADVDRLFARLRAGLPDDEVVEAQATVGAAEPAPDAAAQAGAPARPSRRGRQAEATEPAAPTAEDEPGDEQDLEKSSPTGADAEALARRAEVLDPVSSALARRLKRALQDDQNRLLDQLRQGTGEWSDDLLTGEEAQRELYRKAAAPQLREAVSAGIGFARSLGPATRAKAPTADAKVVDAMAEELAASVVTLLRRRLESDGMPDAAERVGAAYREWRGERIQRLAEDRSLDAFSAGVLAGVPEGTALRWVTGEGGPGCADCDDNALAGEVVSGEEFPTGHRHPPAHAGCRCLVLPA